MVDYSQDKLRLYKNKHTGELKKKGDTLLIFFQQLIRCPPVYSEQLIRCPPCLDAWDLERGCAATKRPLFGKKVFNVNMGDVPSNGVDYVKIERAESLLTLPFLFSLPKFEIIFFVFLRQPSQSGQCRGEAW